MQGGQDKSLRRLDAELFIVSALILFLELVLIRWVGAEIAVFAFLGNLILVICFFGVGLGCYLAAQPISLVRLGVNVLLLAALVANPLRIGALDLKRLTTLLSGLDFFATWKEMTGLTGFHVAGGLTLLGLLLYLIACSFLPLGQVLGRAFGEHPRTIRAYSVNIAGSLAGVWLFNFLSWRSASPTVWFGVAAVLMLLLAVVRRDGWSAVVLLGVTTVVVAVGGRSEHLTIWSPYHKLALEKLADDRGYTLHSNFANYQNLLDLSDGFLRAHPDEFDLNEARFGCYDLPFCFKPKIHRMLIVGAGAGNNAAGALRHGAEQVDCVDIDPVIFALGKQFHPEQPYASPHVQMICDDARAFFKRATGPYDVIWFGWLDSHVLGTSYSNLRLDHYVYTLESIRDAARLLAPDGVIVLTMGAPMGRNNWIGDRQFRLLREVFGHDPVAYAEGTLPAKYGAAGGVTLVCGHQPLVVDDVDKKKFIEDRSVKLPGTTRATTDDWPYLYLESAHIPRLHLVTSLLLLGTVVITRRRVLGGRVSIDWHFFLLGAAFLLLEVQTVSRATLLFGMTWVVNAIVFSAVLVMILLANAVAARWPRLRQGWVAAGLALAIAALAVVPLDSFNALTGVTKLMAASAFLTLPVFFAGLIFIRSFAGCANKSRALGSNLIGALVGGLLESASFITGIRALVVLVGLFYLLALVWRPRRD